MASAASTPTVDGLLAERGFVRDVLPDVDTSRDGILAGLRKLVGETGDDDTVFLYYLATAAGSTTPATSRTPAVDVPRRPIAENPQHHDCPRLMPLRGAS